MTATLTPEPVTSPVSPPEPARRTRREQLGLGVLLLGTAALYLVNLSANGWANEFYSAAVASMTRSWEAFFFGSFDAGNVITVDKPPASLWVMALSARVFGLSTWSLLVPQALMGVATVALLHAAVRRVAGTGAALVAGAVMAVTPVAVLMFRFDNPDALLVLLMVAAAYAVTRAVEHAGTRWLLLAGALLGFAFLAKSAQALLVLPGLALAYLWAAPTGPGRRIWQLLAAGGAMVVTAGWWFVIAALWPAADRPYIGGSTNNSALELAFGYNGLGRIFGQGGGGARGAEAGAAAAGGVPSGAVPSGAVPGGALPGGAEGGLPGAAGGPGGFGGGPGGGGNPFGGNAGLGRLFAADVGGQVAWLLPTALVLLVIAVVLVGRAGRTDRLRSALLLWGGWTVVTALVFSLMEGIFHQYYTVALAPGIAALVGIGGAMLWRRREARAARIAMAALVLLTAGWSWVLLDRAATFAPWVRFAVVVVGVLAAVAFVAPVRGRVVAAAALVAAVVSGLLGPSAYAVQTVATAHTGSIPLAGPSTGGGFGPGGTDGGTRGDRADRGQGTAGNTAGSTAGSTAGGPDGFGGPGESQASDPALVSLLQAAGTKWSAASVGTMTAAPLALASGTDVMAIGGFSGSDPAPTLEQFQAYVAAGQVHYFIVGGGPGGQPGATNGGPAGTGAQTGGTAGDDRGTGGGFGGRGSATSTWVEQHFTATTVGGRTVYDLTKPKA